MSESFPVTSCQAQSSDESHAALLRGGKRSVAVKTLLIAGPLLISAVIGLIHFGGMGGIVNALRGYPIAIELDPVPIQFNAGQTRSLEIPIRNLLSEELVVIGAQPDCSCIKVSGLPVRIAPNETESLHIDISVNEVVRGAFQYHVRLHLNRPSPPVFFSVEFEVLPPEKKYR